MVRQAERIWDAMARREAEVPSNEGPRSINGTVGRREGEILAGVLDNAPARRERRRDCASRTSSRIVGSACDGREDGEVAVSVGYGYRAG